MLFNSVVFLFGFLPIAYAVFWSFKSTNGRYVWLTICGYVFYGYWDARFCLLMAFSTLVSFAAGRGMAHWQDARKRKLCLIVPIVVDLSLLGFFKYANFGLDSVRQVLHLLGSNIEVRHLNVILPLGISFYTFHTISYIVDCYRGVVRPTRNLFEFATYVSLFSQLVAGPIVRFRQIEEDLEQIGQGVPLRYLSRGAALFVVGLVEKVVIADSLASFVDPALAHYQTISSAATWLAMSGYTLQLYFDFSGYSTMAVGLGFLFGLRIPQNFNSPYKALDPADFWRRWHISLSSCLRDYLYIPLGGNRDGEARTYRNLMLTMLFGGLWHGANWTFVVWGAYHGLLLCAYRRYGKHWDLLPTAMRQFGMFILALIGWVFFRSQSFAMASVVLTRLFVPTAGAMVMQGAFAALLVMVAGAWALVGANPFQMRLDLTWGRRLALTAAAGAALAIIVGSRPSPFLYFQF